MPRLYLSLLLSLLIASPASAVTMEWTPIGNPGNACDPQPFGPAGCFGSVPYAYSIGTYEVTNAQYAEFLNAIAVTSDPNALYSPAMGSSCCFGGISRSGSPGSYSYSAIAGHENMPVNYVSFYDALRFANWLQNGQPNTGAQTTGTTEDGAYTLNGANPAAVARNAGATVFLASEDEWYKAAYYNAPATSYFAYPAGSNTQTSCAAPTATPNSGNCNDLSRGPTDLGSYTNSPGPYGTFDQGGNVMEWNEAVIVYQGNSYRGVRGGAFNFGDQYLAAGVRSDAFTSSHESEGFGFRVVMLPEPSTCVLRMTGILGVLGLAGWRRARS